METYLDYLLQKEKQEKTLSRLRIEKEQYINAPKYVRNSNDYIAFMIEYQKVFFKLAQLKKIAKKKFKEYNEED
jgi:hypothetical protein